MRTLAAIALTCAALAGCTASPAPKASGSPAPTPSVSTTTDSPSPSVTPSPTPAPTPSATTDLPDGTHYAYLKSIDLDSRTLVADVVQFLTGDAAHDAATADGKDPDTDYYVRNQNTKLRTLTYVPAVSIVVNTLTAEETGDATNDTTITLARFDAYFADGDAQPRLYYLTVAGGVVTKVHEQYLP